MDCMQLHLGTDEKLRAYGSGLKAGQGQVTLQPAIGHPTRKTKQTRPCIGR